MAALTVLSTFTMPVQATVVTSGESGGGMADSSRVYDIDEVVVISQPKEVFRLRRQPLSASSFSSDQMTRLGVQDLRELSAYVPSFSMPAYGSRYTSSMYIRGIGSRVNSPAVGIYIDGMPIQSKSAFNFHTYELDRVDVLRGPQGTLYGMNTEGGMIRMYSKNPFRYQGTDLSLSVGTALWRKAEVAHYQKLSQRLAFSVAGFYDGQDGFFKNQHTGEKADQFNEGGGKLRLMYRPDSRWEADWMADYQYVRQNGFPYGLMTSQDDGGSHTQDPNTNRQGNYRRNLLNTGLSLTYKGRGYDFNSTTTYQYLKDYMLMDIDYLPEDYMHMEQRQFQNAFTQELSLKGNSSKWWHWTAGAFFSAQWLKTNAPVYFDTEMNKFLSKNITDYAYYGMLNAMAARMGEEAAAAMIARAGGCRIDMRVETIPGLFRTPQYNLGFYHESNIDLTSRLTATLGLRYDYSYTEIDYRTSARAVLSEDVMGQHVDAAVNSVMTHDEHDHFDQLLPKVGLSWRIDNRDSRLYVTVGKGYRAGGYNIQMFSDILQSELQGAAQRARGEMVIDHDATAYDNIAQTIAYKPETSWNYEAGAHLNLFGNAVQLDLAAFYMQVRNQQLSVMAGSYGFGRMMVNAGESSSCGVETSLRGRALDNHLDWAVSYGYTHAVFKEYDDSVKVNGVFQHVSYKDKKVPFVPEHTVAASADYRIDLSSPVVRSLTIGANASAQGKTYWDEANSYYQKLYATVGAHVDLNCRLAGTDCLLSLWGRNLTDTKYNTFAVQSAATGETLTFAQLGSPLQLGLDVKLHF